MPDRSNHRTAVTPVAHRSKLLRQLSDEEIAFVRGVRLIHNGIGTWANALLYREWTIPEIKAKLSAIAKEVNEL